MTDNEKRAHDLAILSTHLLFEMKDSDNKSFNKQNPNNPKDFSFDTFGEYESAYNIFLNRFTSTSK